MKEFVLSNGDKVTVDKGRVTLPTGKVIGDSRGMCEVDALPAHLRKPYAAQWAKTPAEVRANLVWFCGAIMPRHIAAEAQTYWDAQAAEAAWLPEGYEELLACYMAWESYEERKERAYQRESAIKIKQPSETIEQVRERYPDAYAWSRMSKAPEYQARVRRGEPAQQVLAEYEAAKYKRSLAAVENN